MLIYKLQTNVIDEYYKIIGPNDWTLWYNKKMPETYLFYDTINILRDNLGKK